MTQIGTNINTGQDTLTSLCVAVQVYLEYEFRWKLDDRTTKSSCIFEYTVRRIFEGIYFYGVTISIDK